ncbi:hypothetical protein H4S02_011053, partial [Coemansia sp. RSA 2611]
MSRFLTIDSLLNSDEGPTKMHPDMEREQSAASEATAIHKVPEYLPRWDEKMTPGEAMRRFYSAQFPGETRE